MSLAACSSSASSGSSGTTYPDAKSLAAKIGCTEYADTAPSSGQVSSGGCTLNGQPLGLIIFPDAKSAKAWNDSAKAVAGGPGAFGYGENWFVDCPDLTTAKKAVAAAGGTTS